MRTHFIPTRTTGNSILRYLALALAILGLGLVPQVASALEITDYTIDDNGGSGTWTIYGQVDVNEEENEIADIDFGGVIFGLSTTTDYDGTFEFDFDAVAGDTITFTASTTTATSETIEEELSGT
ncbi:MAG: hypothetical protein H8E66_11230 [Planctomycetes bacterium]|nr:hypothetical protein [Planctomycetota bacterium]